VGPSGLREVLSLPARGHETPMPPSLERHFESKVVGRVDGAREERFVVDFMVHYTGWDTDRDQRLALFSRAQRAVYIRQRGSANYSLMPQRSTITMREIQTVFNVDSLSCADFFAFNENSLSEVSSREKGVIARYGSDCDMVPQG